MANEKEMDDILESTKQFNTKMRARLVANIDKGGWVDESSAFLLRRLLQEVAELVQELDQGNAETIEAEAVDVANFAMMIGDVVRLANVMKEKP